jgi:hypothetical protein
MVLTKNDSILITVTSGNNDIKTVSADYVVIPYTLSASVCYNNNTPY